jgi:hypothetical protein
VLLAGENRKIVNIATLSTENTTWNNSGATADLRSERSATNSHSHGRAETDNLIKVHFWKQLKRVIQKTTFDHSIKKT